MGWTFYNASGQRLSTSATSITNLDIDGATDIGAAIVDADLFIIDDGAGGTNRKTAASRIKTYIGGLRSSVWEMPHFVTGTATLSHGGHGFHTAASIGDASSDGQARLSIHVPSDVNTLERAVALFLSAETGNMRIQFDTDFAASGETYNENNDSISEATVAVVAAEILAIDVRNALGGIAAGDELGFRTERSGTHGSDTVTTVYFIGLMLEWS